MKQRLRDLVCVLADTSPFCSVVEALSDDALILVLDYLDAAVKIVTDVHREMNGLSQSRFLGLSTLKAVEMIDEYLRGPALTLDTDLAADVQPIVMHSGLFTPDADRPKKNWGEVATVLAAARLGAPVIMDDREGRKFAKLRKVHCYTTRDLVVQMQMDGAMSADDAYLVWCAAASSRRARRHFDEACAAG